MKTNKLINWFSPIMIKPSLVFNSLEEEIIHHPLIFFYDPDEGVYYYLSARSAINKDKSLRVQNTGEIFIPKIKSGTNLFERDAFVNCSRIYEISEKDLKEFLDNNEKTEINNIEELDYQYVIAIFNKMNECLSKKPPYITYSEIKYDRDTKKLTANTLYTTNAHLKYDIKNFGGLRKKRKDKNIIEKKAAIINKSNPSYLPAVKSVIEKGEYIFELENVEIPLAEWVINKEKQNPKWSKHSFNSKEICESVNKILEDSKKDDSINPIVPIEIDYYNLAKGLYEKGRQDILEEIYKRDFKYMLWWIQEKKLDLGTKAFEKFKNEMQINTGKEYFDYLDLEEKMKNYQRQELIKKEKKQIIETEKTLKSKQKDKKNLNEEKDKTKDDDGWSQGM